MDVVFGVISILSFIVGIIGAWDKIKVWVKSYSLQYSERKLNAAKFDLSEIQKFNDNQSLLIAYLFKQTALLILVVFFVSIFDIMPQSEQVVMQIKAFLFGMSSAFIGFTSGRIFRVTNYVLNYEKLKSRVEIRISKYSVPA